MSGMNKQKDRKISGGCKKKGLWSVLAVLIVILFVSSPVLAVDSPPTIFVKINGLMEGETCYATLLYETMSPYAESTQDDIGRKFAEFKDSDGYVYPQQHFLIEGKQILSWTTFNLPNPFKVLLYFPAYDSFVVSNICDQYEHYYSIDLTETGYQETGSISTATVIPRNTFSIDLMWFVSRVGLILAIEIGIALHFRYREKKQILLIVIVNLLLQIPLVFILSSNYLLFGFILTMISYPFLEFCTFIIKLGIYKGLMKRLSAKPIERSPTVLFTFVTYIVSFLFGLVFLFLQYGQLWLDGYY